MMDDRGHGVEDADFLSVLDSLETHVRGLRDLLASPALSQIVQQYGDAKLRRLHRRTVKGMESFERDVIACRDEADRKMKARQPREKTWEFCQ